VLQAFGNDPKRQRLNAGNGFIAVDAVAHDAGQGRHFRQPAAVLFALKLDGKDHGRNVASGPSNLQIEPTRLTACAIMSLRRIDGNSSSGVARTRPLCPYPQMAVYKGTGSIEEASSFSCTTP
jgi:Tannase and feruloyl esterase